MKFLILPLALWTLSATAQTKTVDQMTCHEAQEFVATHGYFNEYQSGIVLKIASTSWEKLAAKGCPNPLGRPKRPDADVQVTLDNPQCAVGWFCTGLR